MSIDIFRKSLFDRVRLIGIVAGSLAAMNVLVLLLFGSLGEQYAEILDVMPPEILAALGANDLGTPAGWLNAEMFSLVIPIALVGVGIVIGVGAIAGEEDRMTLNVLLAAPVGRMQVAISKVAALILLLAVLGATSWASLVVGAALGNVEIGADMLLAGTVMVVLFGAFFACLAFGIGAATGRPGLAAAVSAGLAVLAFVANAFLPLVDGWERAQELSPFYWYLGTNPLVDGIDLGAAALLGGFAALFVAAGTIAFNRRDIGVELAGSTGQRAPECPGPGHQQTVSRP